MKKSSCQDLVLAVTYECNSRCRMCDIWRKNQAGSLKAEDYAKLPVNILNINITGGEPFLRNDLPLILSVIRENCPKASVIISTNGFAKELIIKQVQAIKQIIPALGVAVSLDAVGDKHDEIRGVPGGFLKVVATIKGLKEVGINNLRLAFTLGDYNIQELKRVYNLSRELGVEMTLAAVHSSDNYFGKFNQIEKKEELVLALNWLIARELRSFSPKRWARAYFAFGLKEYILTGKRILPDYSGRDNLFIDPNGDIYPNDVCGQKIGHLRRGVNDLAPFSVEENSNWMICTARTAMKKHWPEFIFWLLQNNFFTARYENSPHK